MTDATLIHLPLEALHEKAGARFGGFAGWKMPLTYPLGVLGEHLATRQKAGLFDISHMKLIAVSGAEAAAFLSRACPIDAADLGIGRSKYSFLLNPAAGILDDVIVTRLGRERFMIVANAANAAGDIAHLTAIAADFAVEVEPLERVLLALQGPEAAAVLTGSGLDSVLDLAFMQGAEPRQGWFVTRSGYTGEDGFEIALPIDAAPAFAETLLTDPRVSLIGLAARDSLRLEAGLCLHGNDITPETDPVSASLTWAIPAAVRAAGRFVGAEALAAIAAQGPARRRVGLKPDGRQPVRAGAPIFDADGAEVGQVTSGGFGPSAGYPVAMGYVAAPLARPGTRLAAEVRGNRLPLAVHALPFTPHRYHKG